jgi:hypothetical protein
VRRVLGLIGDELYLEMFAILADHRHSEVFRFVDRVIDQGYDISEFQRGLAEAVRNMMIVRLDGVASADIREDLRDAYVQLSQRFAVGDLLRMLSQIAELDTEGRLRKSANPRIMLEALLLRFAHLGNTLDLEALVRGGASPAPASAPLRNASPPRSPAPPGDPAPAPPRSAAPPPATQARGNIQDVWNALVDARIGLPQGLAIFLKVAKIAEPTPGQVLLRVPSGPALEKLGGDPNARAMLERSLSDKLGYPIVLQVSAEDEAAGKPSASPAPRRFTPEQVKSDKLARLAREEPVLGEAVSEWNLELLD